MHRYVCSSVPDHGGCGQLTVAAELVEKLLTDAVLAWSS
ncbi:recombinase [Mycolicibacterium fortuitum subsp. fortuitum DSM 46621 = ATCC 6841 = JCM 6387]|uniref:Recombinase n=1 Tax=Mycolicibacterium fortuitum subsp. fortuitum DSM 46621 = ATCC 6841 = JCM 6387 TaxID=1214102 RepID=K0V4C5_MYCFO|nr:recombinase [Mycolicibacterium fortuitum subsp. fortuitum DSM 46621 = ATCC 6841 = JCM 6387]UHJ53262.1 zinc ribbon domain-containing protein [Mycolicibacterium fortuitum]WEV32996.1 zinc ribbon domain-containing protein [Mycolicibacterium fortuitum]